MTRSRANAALSVACVFALFACSRTTDVFVGSDVDGARGGGAGATDAQVPTPADAGSAAGSGGAGVTAPPPVAADAGAPECTSGAMDCDGDSDNGCEADITSDPAHCGGCGVVCQTADCTCVGGVRVLDCGTQRADCDGDASNGCEVDLMNDPQHCGECTRSCQDDGPGVTGATCTSGSCVLTCQAPIRGDCDGNPANGCETDLFHDPNNCSVCGMQCTICADARCL